MNQSNICQRKRAPARGSFSLASCALFGAFFQFLKYIDGADFYGGYAEILDGGQETGGEDGALGLFVLTDDEVERRRDLRIERDDAVAALLVAMRRFIV